MCELSTSRQLLSVLIFLFLWADTTLSEEHKGFTPRALLEITLRKHQGEWKEQLFWLRLSQF